MRRSFWVWVLPAVLFLLLPGAVSAQGDAPARGALSAALTGQHALRRGDRGPAVTSLQTLLRDRGFDPTKIDGIFGPLTEEAVRQAQAAYGLHEDGLAGAQTALALEHGSAPAATAAAPAPATTATATSPAPTEDAAATPAPSAVVQEPSVVEGPALPTSTLVIHQVTAAPAAATAPAGAETPAAVAQFALTFNGMPDPALLPGILTSLKQHGMHATFFITAQAARERADLVAQIAAAGHEVADGGPSADGMAGLGAREAQAALRQAQSAIAKAAGKAPVFFRPPQGALSQPLVDAAAALGMRTMLWTNAGVTDDPAADPTELGKRLLDAVYPGSVLMLHQDRAVTAQVLDDLLTALAGRSIQSVTLSELLHT